MVASLLFLLYSIYVHLVAIAAQGNGTCPVTLKRNTLTSNGVFLDTGTSTPTIAVWGPDSEEVLPWWMCVKLLFALSQAISKSSAGPRKEMLMGS